MALNSEKIVVLNSGGFDSIVLIHEVRYSYPEAEIHSVHFNYGERNKEQQDKCVDKVCKKLGLVNCFFTLPKFEWTKSKFYEEEYDISSQYLEYRNLIFISYAVSYAQSIGAKKIFIATYADGYEDNSPKFIRGINKAIESSGIQILAPFSKIKKASKESLVWCLNEYKIEDDEYFSCDKPKEDGTPCGECDDCLALKRVRRIKEELYNHNHIT